MTTVGVVGLGYVGLPLAVAFATEGCDVIALDVDPRKIEAIHSGDSYIEDVSDADLAKVRDQIHATSRYACLAKADAIILCVPTPLTRNREPDLTPLISAAQALGEVLQAGQLVVLESTTYPGTTRDRVAPLLEESGLTAGEDFHLAFSPERVDPGRTDFTLRTTPKVLGGLTPTCSERAEALYGIVCDQVVLVSTPEAAELTKLLENIFRSVNIALVNELAMLTDRMGIDIWEVVDAASTKPYGFMRFEPGPGMGGHCLPVDPFYLSWRAREFDMTTEFIELAGKVNQQMPYHCVAKAQRALNGAGMSVQGARVAIVGVSYKPGVGDIRESPAIRIISLLRDLGANIRYHDPYVRGLPEFGLSNTSLEETLLGADLALIVTAHPDVDHALVAERAQVVVDLRGVLRRTRASSVVSL
jgi:UDP-N-acetyl-D-glucosamine dehydrogenase